MLDFGRPPQHKFPHAFVQQCVDTASDAEAMATQANRSLSAYLRPRKHTFAAKDGAVYLLGNREPAKILKEVSLAFFSGWYRASRNAETVTA